MEKEIGQLASEFEKRFSSKPRLFQAPGRVNLIGEHTDYNDGFVLPFAIDRRTLVAAAARDDRFLNVYARDLDETGRIDLSADPEKQRGSWLDYVEGTARCVSTRFNHQLRGADLIITSTVPIGAGLSSSAAIEVAVGSAVLHLSGLEFDRKKLAFAAQQAEHEFVGTRSGIMDQFTSVFAKEGKAMLLDCRSLDIEYISVEKNDVGVAVIDTKVKHNLASGEYNTRRRECEEGVAILKRKLRNINSLRDVTPEDLIEHDALLPDPIRQRCRHVVSENCRTLDAAKAFRSGDFATAGTLMWESHRSLRDDYEVSCAELDFLVDTAGSIDGVFGARMTGGGFGGCTVNLVGKSAIDDLRSTATEKYAARFGFEPDFYLFKAADGASEVTF
ncbi:MAG TPA: galactokinase [Pyrinomonadaceae bacterium]